MEGSATTTIITHPTFKRNAAANTVPLTNTVPRDFYSGFVEVIISILMHGPPFMKISLVRLSLLRTISEYIF